MYYTSVSGSWAAGATNTARKTMGQDCRIVCESCKHRGAFTCGPSNAAAHARSSNNDNCCGAAWCDPINDNCCSTLSCDLSKNKTCGAATCDPVTVHPKRDQDLEGKGYNSAACNINATTCSNANPNGTNRGRGPNPAGSTPTARLRTQHTGTSVIRLKVADCLGGSRRVRAGTTGGHVHSHTCAPQVGADCPAQRWRPRRLQCKDIYSERGWVLAADPQPIFAEQENSNI